MIFTRENIERIRAGQKTETRRVWKAPHARVGGVYRVRAGRWAATDPRDPSVRVVEIRLERLGDISPESVRREGYETRDGFMFAWTQLHGAWLPDLHVTVVRFEVVEG